jgi:hypothetical protein
MSHESIVVSSGNLSLAWADAFLRVLDAPDGVLSNPLMLSVTEFDKHREPVEDAAIRRLLDEQICGINAAAKARKVQDVSATASTIFPYSSWSPRAPRPAAELFERYRVGIFPRLKALSNLNNRGTYFLRMIQSPGLRRDGEPVNQIGDILKWWHRDAANGKRTRRSAMQVSIYDPPTDHTGSGQGGFPCLQQVSFGWDDGGLVLSAYYPTEYVFDRGYGNYLGLCQLGTFMAHEMNLALHRVNVFVALPELGSIPKRTLSGLATALRPMLAEQSEASKERAA